MVRRIPPTDREKTKVASFRISEGEWFDFSEEADRQNVTATDVIKGAIRNFMAGDFVMPIEPEPTPETLNIGIGTDIESLVSTLVNTAVGKLSILGIDRVTEIARGEVELGLTPLSNDLVSLQSQLAEVKSDCDLATEGIQRLIADAISKASIATTAKKPQPTAIKTASASGEPNNEVIKVANRLEREPALKSAVIDGLAAGHTGESLGQYLADNSFLNSNGGKYTGASNSRFRLAIEYLNSLENGGQD
jgi:hypothetical protein